MAEMLKNCISSTVVVDSISTQKGNASVKGITTNILRGFFLAYNIDVAVFHCFVTADRSPFFQDHSTQ